MGTMYIALRRLRQEDSKFMGSLSYFVRPCGKTQRKDRNKRRRQCVCGGGGRKEDEKMTEEEGEEEEEEGALHFCVKAAMPKNTEQALQRVMYRTSVHAPPHAQLGGRRGKLYATVPMAPGYRSAIPSCPSPSCSSLQETEL